MQGIVSNKNGIGARVELYGNWGLQLREVRSGTSFSPMKSLNVHFGIGAVNSIDSVRVLWPSGMITTLPNPAINQTHLLIEANCIASPNIITANGNTDICPGTTVTQLFPLLVVLK